jgi:hypothetical protein
MLEHSPQWNAYSTTVLHADVPEAMQVTIQTMLILIFEFRFTYNLSSLHELDRGTVLHIAILDCFELAHQPQRVILNGTNNGCFRKSQKRAVDYISIAILTAKYFYNVKYYRSTYGWQSTNHAALHCSHCTINGGAILGRAISLATDCPPSPFIFNAILASNHHMLCAQTVYAQQNRQRCKGTNSVFVW